jgi:hypothetical protein
MKQKIYTLGLITTSAIVIGGLLKINHWPGAAYFLIIGIVMLVLVFLPLALRNHYRTEGERKNLLLYIVTWVTGFVVFGGMLFKTMHWPGAGIALTISLPFPYVVFLPVFLVSTSRDKNFDINNTVAVLCLLAAVSIFSALLALNVSKEKINDSMELSASYNRLEKVLDELPAPAGKAAVMNKYNDLLMIVDDYQNRIFTTDGITEQQWIDDPWSLKRPETADFVNKALITGKGKNSTLDLRLQTGLGDLVSELENSAPNEKIAGNVPLIFNYMATPGNKFGWTEDNLIVSPGVWSVIYLDGLETTLKLLRAAGAGYIATD